ncbi:Glu/Leu/Phe/Val family dehydrogenase [Alteribacillus iranensis]|uniref:Leucine dehydrogenase n=1 Tax=Alteribacillus iranensis TaxID=930128 RepID=A0A1I1ZI95_9BACI|nr:Glu/Leu/Phe/Val dehydrogenase [Alteribacillus iranensis]SFE31554.1 leucine dehydrogenase [Alteribacillus iranensis]
MQIFDRMVTDDYEQVVVCQDKASGLKGIIAIHDTTLGPALGGTRMWNYHSEEEAFTDVLRLAKGMTYKNAAAGLSLGGGKAVIIGDPRHDKKEELFRAFGRFIEGLNGRYITAEDVGTSSKDMDVIFEETNYVTGITDESGKSGDPSPMTALGVYHGMKAAANEAFGTSDLLGKTVAVQGVGSVSYPLCQHLYEEGASLVVTDIHEDAVQRAVRDFNAVKVAPDEIYEVDCDIFCPCALGGIIKNDTIKKLKAKVIAGSANNQLHTNEDGDLLFQKGIIYAPDYIINAGGVIQIEVELTGGNKEKVQEKVKNIYNTVQNVFAISKRDKIPTYKAADTLAEERLEKLKNSRRQFLREEQHILRKISR